MSAYFLNLEQVKKYVDTLKSFSCLIWSKCAVFCNFLLKVSKKRDVRLLYHHQWSVGITFGDYSLLLCLLIWLDWLSSRIFLRFPIVVMILILLILAVLWLWTRDDWILCWLKLFYCWLLGKDCMMSFSNSKWHLGNWWLFYCIRL